jgi:hypothetical protein
MKFSPWVWKGGAVPGPFHEGMIVDGPLLRSLLLQLECNYTSWCREEGRTGLLRNAPS